MSGLRELMEEPIGGPNAGRAASPDPSADGGRRLPLETNSARARSFIRDGGWTIACPWNGDRGGTTAHRGVLHPDEWVDYAWLLPAVEGRLGFTVAELRWVYRQGRKSAAQRELRARVDARLLEVAQAGGNLTLLALVTGVNRKTLARALARGHENAPLGQVLIG